MKYYERRHLFSRVAIAATAIIGMALAGCAETSRPAATGKGTVRGINAVVTSPELIFLNEERGQGTVNYRGTAGYDEWDDLDYTFNFDIIFPGDTERTRIASQYIDVVADMEYTIVLTGSIANPSIITWENEERTWAGTETVFDADFAHLSPQFGQVDIFFAPAGTAPVAGMEVGTLSYGERIPHQDFEADDYVLILTAPGDPSTILYESPAFTRTPAERITFALFDPDPSNPAPVGINIIFAGGGAQTLSDIASPPEIRTLHTAFGTPSFDGYLDPDLTSIVFPNIAYSELSAYEPTIEILAPLTLTPVGDSSSTIFTTDVQRVNNTRRTIALFGEPGSLFALTLPHNARPLETHPVVRITHFSSNIAEIDLYEVDPGTVLDETVPPKFTGSILGISTPYFDAGVGMREFVLTLPDEKDPIAPRVTLDLVEGDIVDMAIIDTADPTVVELLVFDSTL